MSAYDPKRTYQKVETANRSEAKDGWLQSVFGKRPSCFTASEDKD